MGNNVVFHADYDTLQNENIIHSELVYTININELFNNMIGDMIETTKTTYIDIEHLLFKHIGPDRSHEMEYLHLMGATAPTAQLIYD